MTEPDPYNPDAIPCKGVKLCGKPHPTEQTVCIRPPGTNAYDRETCSNVHVHYGTTGEGLKIAGWSWRDAPAPE